MRREEKFQLNNKDNQKLSYIRELYSKEDVLLKNIRNDCLLDNRPITINPEEGKLLQILIKLSNVKTIIEVGTLFGYSTIWLARALPSDGKIYTIEKEKYNFQKAIKNFNKMDDDLKNKIVAINGDAQEKLSELIKKDFKFDMMFIDADKSNYLNYLNLSKKLVKKNGLIVADNTLLSSAVYLNYLPSRVTVTSQNVMREFNKQLADASKYNSIMLGTDEGLSIAQVL